MRELLELLQRAGHRDFRLRADGFTQRQAAGKSTAAEAADLTDGCPTADGTMVTVWCLDPANSPDLMRALRPHWRPPAVDVAWVGEGWRELVRECHDRLVERFANYELINIQDQQGDLDYFALPEPADEDSQAVEALLAPVVERAAATCMWCGSVGSKRSSRAHVLVLCDGCDVRFSDPPRPGFD